MLTVLVGSALLSGCGEDDTAGVGAGPGPAAPVSGVAPGDLAASQPRLQRIAERMRGGGAPSDEGALPGGEMFDGAGAFGKGAGSSAVRASYAHFGGGSRQGYTLSAGKRYAARGGVPPTPGSLPQVALPQADPIAGARGGGPVLQAFDAFQRKTYEAALPVLSRLAWGARAPIGSQPAMHPSHVTVHHTDGHQRTKLSDSV
jgi:hypothetical protein